MLAVMAEPGSAAQHGMRDCIPHNDIDPAQFRHECDIICSTLMELGVRVATLRDEQLKECPDAAFLEDRVATYGKTVLYAYPAQDSPRRPEMDRIPRLMKPILDKEFGPGQYREVHVTGSDIYHDIGDQILAKRADGRQFLFVGYAERAARTSPRAIRMLQAVLSDITVVPVKVARVQRESNGALHLDSAATFLGKNTVILRSGRVDPRPFREHGFDVWESPDNELSGAACLVVPKPSGDRTFIVPTECTETRRTIEAAMRCCKRTIDIRSIKIPNLLRSQAGPACTVAWINRGLENCGMDQ